ncbi:unnamed protein product, partial [marine sediment metagenome]
AAGSVTIRASRDVDAVMWILRWLFERSNAI